MASGSSETPARDGSFRFSPDRDRLLAEAHARPSRPLPGPTIATRIAALSGTGGSERDLAHMVALCRRLGTAEPGPGARWSVVDAGTWHLRWERHTEMSTWTFYRAISDDHAPVPGEAAHDLAPQDWLMAIPGDVLVACHVILTRTKPASPIAAEDEVAAAVADESAKVFTDFRPGPDGFTRIHVVQPLADATVAGRIVQQVFEIETYRLLALSAFPLATAATGALDRLETEAAAAALEVGGVGGMEADRALLYRLAGLASEAQALEGRTSFRFSAARAYQGLVQERIQQLRETRIDARPTIAEFMERRLAPAMRTCVAVAERQQRVVQHIARTTQLLSTRTNVAAETTNASLLASMDRRARLQLRLQQTVEGLSVVAISYYLIGIAGYAFKAVKSVWHDFNPELATGLAAPLAVLIVWLGLRRMRRHLLRDEAVASREPQALGH
jgi:uncharacterized membrane-anchored protein